MPKSPDPTPFMRWWDRKDWDEMLFIRGITAEERNDYTKNFAAWEIDRAVKHEVYNRARLLNDWYSHCTDPIVLYEEEKAREADP